MWDNSLIRITPAVVVAVALAGALAVVDLDRLDERTQRARSPSDHLTLQTQVFGRRLFDLAPGNDPVRDR